MSMIPGLHIKDERGKNMMIPVDKISYITPESDGKTLVVGLVGGVSKRAVLPDLGGAPAPWQQDSREEIVKRLPEAIMRAGAAHSAVAVISLNAFELTTGNPTTRIFTWEVEIGEQYPTRVY
ncbi:hypothetical protein GU243_00980 [Pseudarthrobacter psychrotolerans]|uniref:Uncharacterized protein n=1 Tax=Pseudarthrobacter psychrotolerans TaxID=2697569 RepID=A0A6P1NHD0_9MICC|nr:hypothetical protein [Pseudarthrobacter psychrotolerans]QHK18583.1 hypothetical protein GU243_00980 [Pseudarthrobacter psychrotolerans]